jgi:hypothetical protein
VTGVAVFPYHPWEMVGHVDQFHMFSIHGWAANADHPDPTVDVAIVHNGRTVAIVPARGFHADLLGAGQGDAGKAFWFNPFEYLEYGENRFEVRYAGTGTLVPNGVHTLYYDMHSAARLAAEASRARAWWLASDSGPSPDAFIDAIAGHVDLTELPSRKVLELEPGSRRLVRALLDRGHSCRSYTGLSLSEERADATSERVEADCDLFVCSAAFERLYPSFVPTLRNIQRHLVVGGWACVDFVQLDPEMLVSEAWFEPKARGGAFVRVYARTELERSFTACGFEVSAIASISAGRGPDGEPFNRILVCARNAGIPAPAPAEVDLSDAPRSFREAAGLQLGRQRRWLWKGLRRLRNSGPVKPIMDRISTRPAYVALKARVSAMLGGRSSR